ncbi:hypothetical protein FEZ51_09190 [Pediococcus stilesii]|uniref:Uncharacterized protein n=1 Tax=Pediococcus stilesii TaxID=331679 RepID=A0A5R9BTY9_9LACO|nr:hypothetical protein [Pediococcus stilesii]TLQ03461.1 hypothetical protein FEZ51_09190 [Pediococcus stilesii]
MDGTAEKIVKEFQILSREAPLPKQILKHESFKNIWHLLNTTEYIGYAPISRFAFQYEELDAFKQSLQEAGFLARNDEESFYNEVAEKNFLKILDHMELVSIQSQSIDSHQQRKIDLQNEKLESLKSSLKKANDELVSLQKNSENLANKLTADFVTILGIFTSITFATFGGLQLLGNVFGKIRSTDAVSVGSEVMLGAIFLFGTYMILVALLTGISKLIGKEYRTSFPTRFLIVFSFFTIFMFELIYSNIDYVEDIFIAHPLISMIVAIITRIVISVIAFIIDYRYRKSWSRQGSLKNG